MSLFGKPSGAEPRITYERYELSAEIEAEPGFPPRAAGRQEPRIDRPRLPAPASVPGTGAMLIAADSELDGQLRSRGVIRVEGIVRGSLSAPVVLVETGGSVDGVIEAERVRINGTLRGSLEAREVEVARSATVEAELVYEEISIERGAKVRGLHRQRDPEPPAPEEAAPAVAEAVAPAPEEPAEAAAALTAAEAVPLADAAQTAALVAEAEAALQELAMASQAAAGAAAELAEAGLPALVALEEDLRAVPERLLLDKPVA